MTVTSKCYPMPRRLRSHMSGARPSLSPANPVVPLPAQPPTKEECIAAFFRVLKPYL